MGFRRKFAGVLLCILLAGTASAGEFSFAALGDTPYTVEEEPRFISMIAELNRERLAFVVHIGDFKAAHTPCSDELFLQRRQWFDLVRHPFVFVPGDNEWTDCRRPLGEARDPLERLRKLRELFHSGDASLGQAPMALARQPAATKNAHPYPEHARWEHGGVLFLTLNAPGGDNHFRADPAEYERRSPAQRDWLVRGFRQARDRQAKAVVVIMHGNPWTMQGRPRRGFAELMTTLTAETRGYAGQVLLVHGDTHVYRVDQPLQEGGNGKPLANFTRVEVFGYPAMNWVRIRVREEQGRIRFEATPGA